MLYGCDISRFQDDSTTPSRINFKKMVDAGISFIGIRCLFGVTKDRDFDYNWKAARDAGLIRTAYHFVTVGSTAQEQLDAVLTTLRDDKGELPVTHDYERYLYATNDWRVPKIGNLKYLATEIAKEHKRKGIVYTGYYTWRDYGGWNDNYWLEHPLWIATYSHTPLIPKPWTNWTFWQYTDKGNGSDYGVESKNIDLDQFQGTEADLCKLANLGIVTPAPTDSVILDGNYRVQCTESGIITLERKQ